MQPSRLCRRVAPVLLAALTAVTAAGAAPRPAHRSLQRCPAPVQIGVLPGGTDSRALGINGHGDVVGWSYTILDSQHFVVPFAWTRAGGIVDLHSALNFGGPAAAASDINDSGQIVGWGENTSHLPNAFSWTSSGGLVNLGTLPGGSESRATRVNSTGEIVGWADTTKPLPGADSGIRHGFIWTAADGMKDLGTLGGTASTAAAINDSGVVVGYSDLANGSWHAFSWTPGGGAVDLGTLGGFSSTAHAVNGIGQVAGQSETADGDPAHAFSWTPTGGMVDLGTLGGFTSSARGINDHGEIVGFSDTATGAVHAFSWTQAGGMLDLGALTGSGDSQAEAVNESGDIAGWQVNRHGHSLATFWPGGGGSPACLAALPHAVNVTVSGTGLHLLGSNRWKPGVTEIGLSSATPKSALLTLLRLRAGYSFDRFLADQARAEHGGFGADAASRRLLANAVFIGGVNGHPGASSFTVNLAAGTYYLGAATRVSRWMKIRVVGGGVAHPPVTKAFVTAYDFGFRTSERLSAEGTIRIRSLGAEPHRLTFFPVRPGTTRMQLTQWVRATAGLPGKSAPFALRGPELATSLISPGQSIELSYRLPPGKYALISPQRDPYTGKTQLAEGMYDLVTLH